MDAGESSKPKSLAEIGRSGTFIIEPTADKENENDDVVIGKPVQDIQKASVLPKSSQDLRRDSINNRRRSSDVKTTNEGGKSSEIDYNHDRKKSLDIDTGTKIDGRGPAYGRRRRDRNFDGKTKRGSPDISSRNESLEVFTRTNHGSSLDTGTENRRVEWLDVTAKSRELEMTNSAAEHDKKDSLDNFTKTEPLDVDETDKTESPKVVDTTESPQDVTDAAKTGGNDVTSEEGGRELLDVVSKDDEGSLDVTQTGTFDATAKSKQESADALEDIRGEPLDVTKMDDEVSSSVPVAEQKADAFDSALKYDKKESTDVTMQGDQQDDDNDVEAETKQSPSKRMIADSSIMADEALQNIQEERTDPEVVAEPQKRASRSSFGSSLDAENKRPVPVPAPRKSASKVKDERGERYSVLRANFRQKWKSVANIPKFQNFDRKTRSVLQEQVDRLLGELCPPNYGDDLSSLIVAVEQALERFYSRKLRENDSSKDNYGGGQDMASQKITLEVVQEILLEEDPRIKVLSFTDEPGSGRGDNYTAMLYRVSINGELDGEPWKGSLIIKVLPQSLYRRETYKSDVLFKNEVAFYKRMLPALQRFQMERSGDVNRLIPRCVYAKDDIIALEDLRNTGFVMADRRKGLDAAEMEVVVREVARFHGMSLALKEEDRETFEREILANVRETFFVPENEEWYRGYYQAAIKNTVATVRESLPPGIEAEKIMTSLSTFLNKDSFFGQMVEFVKPIEPLSVLCHGDCWTNNILFRKTEEGEIEEMRLVDFQVCRYGSPCLDLAMLFYVCTNRALRQAHMDRLLRLYHSSLVETLNILSPKKSDDSPQPFYTDSEKLWEMLEKDMRRLAHFGLGIAVDMIPISTCDKEDAPDVYENDDPNYTPGPCAVPAYSDLSRARMTELVQELSQAGILS